MQVVVRAVIAIGLLTILSCLLMGCRRNMMMMEGIIGDMRGRDAQADDPLPTGMMVDRHGDTPPGTMNTPGENVEAETPQNVMAVAAGMSGDQPDAAVQGMNLYNLS